MPAKTKKIKILLQSLKHFTECKKCDLYKEKECMVAPDSMVVDCMTPALDFVFNTSQNIIYVVCHDFSRSSSRNHITERQ